MKSLKKVCEDIVYKKCNYDIKLHLKWLNCGIRCIPFKLMANEYWYCTCKRRNFIITKKKKKSYTISSQAHNCFHCWFTFLIEIKIKIIYKKRNNLVQLAILLI